MPAASLFDRELIARYDRPGPRYTSYPTAVQFEEGHTPVRQGELLEAEPDRPLALYVHLPFCRSLCWFCGCNIVPTRDPSRANAYLESLLGELALVRHRLGPGRRLVEMHWGGGSPTFLEPALLSRLGSAIHASFAVSEDAELSVEMDPRETTREHVRALSRLGFKRMSVGLQDLDPRVQQAVHRVQGEALTRQTMDWGRALGFHSLNLDLMYGLPHQSVASFGETLEHVVAMLPERVALFNFAYLPQLFRHQRAIKAEHLPDAETKLAILELAVARLEQAGYVFIGMDHFALRGDPLARALDEGRLTRSFQGYAIDRGASLVALGVSAISSLATSYAQNEKTVEAYAQCIASGQLATKRGVELTPDDQLRRAVINDLMCRFRLDKRAIEARFGIVFDESFREETGELQGLERDGLVSMDGERIEVTPRGRFLVRNVAMVFDAYLRRQALVAYSRTV